MIIHTNYYARNFEVSELLLLISLNLYSMLKKFFSPLHYITTQHIKFTLFILNLPWKRKTSKSVKPEINKWSILHAMCFYSITKVVI
jgi:hypothetical protein